MNGDFSKYLTPGDDDKKWGLYLTVVGKGIVRKNECYPKPEHPLGYYFTWAKGRVLQEFQLVYITNGAGLFEYSDGELSVRQGSMIIVRPGVWHRYKPLENTGWHEVYVGFNGTLAEHFLQHPLFLENKPVIDVGIREDIRSLYFRIEDLIKAEKPGFQKIASGMVIELLGSLVSLENQKPFTGRRLEAIIEEVRYNIRTNVEKDVDWQQIANGYCLGYSYFRKMFRKYTGMSPHQYHLELKLLKAKELLVSTDKSVKEICFETGFQSCNYFSRLFKEKIGVNPSEFRLT